MLHRLKIQGEDCVLSSLQISAIDKLWQIVIENNELNIEESVDSQISPSDGSVFGNYRACFSDCYLLLFHTSEKAPISQLNLEGLLGEAKEKSLCWLNQYTIVLCFSNQEQFVVSPVSLLNESKSSNVSASFKTLTLIRLGNNFTNDFME